MDSLGIASAGLQTALARFEASAQRTAAAPMDDFAQETVERLQAQRAIEANASVVRAADDMTGMLLDMMA